MPQLFRRKMHDAEHKMFFFVYREKLPWMWDDGACQRYKAAWIAESQQGMNQIHEWINYVIRPSLDGPSLRDAVFSNDAASFSDFE